LQSYVIENILFKISFPAEFHAQTAVECAIVLHPQLKNRLQDVQKIVISTQESALRIISKTGPLYNPADRDHCLQYMVAIGLLCGNLTAEHYEDQAANDPRIAALREKMIVEEDPQFSQDYLDPNKRSIGNAIQVFFNDGSKTERIAIEYPVGHPRRRKEGIGLLIEKFKKNLGQVFSDKMIRELTDLFLDQKRLASMAVDELMGLFVIK
jgi:2-methylcitrate dehydratase